MLIIMAGLPGCGKTTLARAVASALSGTVLNKDEIRHTIFAERDIEYSTSQDDFCLEIMLQVAEYIFEKHPARFIFLDGRTFSRAYQIERVLDLANRLQQPWRILECHCSDASARTRLSASSDHPAGNRHYSLYLEVKRRFEPIEFPKTLIDTELPLEDCVAAALAALKA